MSQHTNMREAEGKAFGDTRVHWELRAAGMQWAELPHCRNCQFLGCWLQIRFRRRGRCKGVWHCLSLIWFCCRVAIHSFLTCYTAGWAPFDRDLTALLPLLSLPPLAWWKHWNPHLLTLVYSMLSLRPWPTRCQWQIGPLTNWTCELVASTDLTRRLVVVPLVASFVILIVDWCSWSQVTSTLGSTSSPERRLV